MNKNSAGLTKSIAISTLMIQLKLLQPNLNAHKDKHSAGINDKASL